MGNWFGRMSVVILVYHLTSAESGWLKAVFNSMDSENGTYMLKIFTHLFIKCVFIKYTVYI